MLVRGRWRRYSLAILVLVGVSVVVMAFMAGPDASLSAASWPIMVAMGILVQFRSTSGRFQHTEQWTTALPSKTALDSVLQAFRQPGLSARVEGHDVRVEIGRDWTGGIWLHGPAAHHLKTTTEVYFQIDDADGPTRITAHSGDRTVMGMYDVLKLCDEMSATAVEVAREATSHHPPANPHP